MYVNSLHLLSIQFSYSHFLGILTMSIVSLASTKGKNIFKLMVFFFRLYFISERFTELEIHNIWFYRISAITLKVYFKKIEQFRRSPQRRYLFTEVFLTTQDEFPKNSQLQKNLCKFSPLHKK